MEVISRVWGPPAMTKGRGQGCKDVYLGPQGGKEVCTDLTKTDFRIVCIPGVPWPLWAEFPGGNFNSFATLKMWVWEQKERRECHHPHRKV
jgi:hypothetical protein